MLQYHAPSRSRAIFGGRIEGVLDHVRGCAGASFTEPTSKDDEREVELSSSPISMIASPLSVSSVHVGDAGDCGPFSVSFTTVSPVIERAGAIREAGLEEGLCATRAQQKDK